METITLRQRNGQTSTAEAEIRRGDEGRRVLKAASIFFGSLLLGLASIAIPVAHLVLPWALPLGGLAVAAYTMSVKAVVDKVTGTCPGCGKPMELPGGAVEDPMWRRCPHCTLPLQLMVSPAPSTTGTGSGDN